MAKPETGIVVSADEKISVPVDCITACFIVKSGTPAKYTITVLSTAYSRYSMYSNTNEATTITVMDGLTKFLSVDNAQDRYFVR